MTVRLDPSGEELRLLLSYAGDLAHQRVLEIGCGDGRLTSQYAARANQVVAIDPNSDCIAQANQKLSTDLRSHVTYATYDLMEFPLGEHYDLAILSWSL